jgi:predicted signal transduction protein with EAL and GGDEF domain
MMSTRDGMTGVFNRRHWEMLLRNEFEHCRRSHCNATILLIDIDHFKTSMIPGGMTWAIRRLLLLPVSFRCQSGQAMR